VLHDVGKIGVPDRILNKPGPLSNNEWGLMRQHPELGIRIVEPIGFSPTATDIILSHHEHWDGTGYPFGLNRGEIPLPARLFSVVDSYDAMTHDRPYRAAMATEDALQIIKAKSGTVYDPEIVDIFIDLSS
jgi:HD-GYP domain-containing protein (c-di-GMP phosphodiesterase class II)